MAWAHGGTLKYGTVGGAEGSMTTVGTILEIDAGKIKRKAISNTPLSVSDATEVKRPGLITQDALKLKLSFDKTVHGTMLGIFAADTNKDWLFTLSDGSKILRTGWIADIDLVPKQTNDDDLIVDMSLEFTGAHTYTAAS